MSTLSSEYQHADIVAKHSMCSRFDVCMLISAWFCALVNACVMTQLGGCFKSRRISSIGGILRCLSDHS